MIGKVSNKQSTVGSSVGATTYHLLPIVYFLISLLLPISMVAQRSKNSKPPKPHYEDLTEHRLKFPALEDSILTFEDEVEVKILPPDNAVTEKVNVILDSIARFNKARLFIDGYTIQIYSGLKREEAMNSIKRLKDVFKDVVVDLRYDQPKFRVRSGSYYTRLEAQRDLRKLKQIIPTAILVPEKVALK